MPPRIWQPEHPTPGWLQAEQKSDLTVYLPLEKDMVVPMHFCRIHKGEFRMGSRGNHPSEEPIHLVRIPQDFYIGTFPVTQVQYVAMTNARIIAELQAIERNEGEGPSDFDGYYSLPSGQSGLLPREDVSRDEANMIGRWLSCSGLLADRWQAGLPSEAMWEYACRAGEETDYWRGDGELALAEAGWHDGNSGYEMHPVGELPANGFGLYDMHGNLGEWCADDHCDGEAYRTRVDGGVAATASNAAMHLEDHRHRVLRGGSCRFMACRSAFRQRGRPGDRLMGGGLRLCVFRNSDDSEEEPETTVAAAEPRDEPEQARAAGGAPAMDLSQMNFSAATRAGK